MKLSLLKIWIIISLLTMALVACNNSDTTPANPEHTKARIKPEGKVNIAKSTVVTTTAGATPVTPTPSTDIGKQIYDKHCVVCHATGVAGAPKFGDINAWKPHLAKGNDVLWDHLLHGFNAMPPKGTCAECTDADLKAALDYMVKNNSGKS